MAGDGTKVKDFLVRGKGDRRETGGTQAGDRGGDVRSSHILHHSQ
ncbi:hypothetical protein [Microcoleus sp. Pol12B4]